MIFKFFLLFVGITAPKNEAASGAMAAVVKLADQAGEALADHCLGKGPRGNKEMINAYCENCMKQDPDMSRAACEKQLREYQDAFSEQMKPDMPFRRLR